MSWHKTQVVPTSSSAFAGTIQCCKRSLTVMPSHVLRWDYNREGPAVEGKMEGNALYVMRQHRVTHAAA